MVSDGVINIHHNLVEIYVNSSLSGHLRRVGPILGLVQE